MWKHTGQKRPGFAIEPGPGQESVWDYPRPPAQVQSDDVVEIRNDDTLIARSERAIRVLETASPPTVYIPPDDVNQDHLVSMKQATFCEWKGTASYWALAADPDTAVGWSYPDPKPAFEAIRGWFCFYPGRVRCFLGDEEVRPQSGPFYGGWVTYAIVGPYKGEPGSGGW